MGCSESRVSNPEERQIIFAEEALCFNGQDPEKLDYAIRKFSDKQLVDNTQFKRIAEMLGLQIENYQTHSKIENFYESMQDENGCFSMTELLVLGLMLSNGDPRLVSHLLIQSFDKMSKSAVSVDILQNMFELIAKMSIKMGNLVVNYQTSESDELKIMRYMQNLTSAKENVIRDLLGRFALHDNSVREDSFVEIFSGSMGGKLTTMTGWRALIRDSYLSEKTRKD